MLEEKIENSSNEILFAEEKPKANNGNNPAFHRRGGTRQSYMDTWSLGLLKRDIEPHELKDSFIKPLTTVHITMAHTSVASSKPEVELDSHADTCVIGDNYSVTHNHYRPVNVCSCNPKDGHRSAKTNDVH